MFFTEGREVNEGKHEKGRINEGNRKETSDNDGKHLNR
jgi:hypothetical protein